MQNLPTYRAIDLQHARSLIEAEVHPCIIALPHHGIGREHIDEVRQLTEFASSKNVYLLIDEASFLETTSERYQRVSEIFKSGRRCVGFEPSR